MAMAPEAPLPLSSSPVLRKKNKKDSCHAVDQEEASAVAVAVAAEKEEEEEERAGFGDEEESLQELARKLPEGDALPDGFSDCPTEIQSNNSKHHQHHISTTSLAFSSPSPSPSSPEAGKGRTINSDSPSSSASVSFPMEVPSDPFALEKTSVVATVICSSSSDGEVLPANLNEIPLACSSSPTSHSSSSSSSFSPAIAARTIDKPERMRRFPVQLSPLENPEEEEKENRDVREEGKASTVEAADFSTNPGDGITFPPSAVEETIEAHKREPRKHHGFDITEDDSEIDELISGTALAENGDQTLEGLHSSLLEDEIQDLRKQNEQLMNEKIATSAQLAKSLTLREKLESLCRELQRQNKQLSDECKRIASEEQQKRLDLSTKFHDAIKDITAKLEEQGEERIQQIKENELLQQKLIQFTQQYEVKEQHYAHQLKTKTLEQNLLEVKLKQQEELNKQAEAKVHHYAEQMTELLKTEQDLRSRLALYGDKFEQFQETLTKSNEVFSSFKVQMEKMSKTIKKLEKENLALQKKCENSDVTLIELVDERATLKKQLETTRNQKEKLETLCRTLQTERKQYKLALSNAVSSASESDPDATTPALKVEQVMQADLA